MSDRTLEDRVAVVTGASSGIGAATARALVDAGFAVVVAARSEGDLRRLAADLEDAGGTVRVVPTDVTDQGDIEALVAATREAYGRLDVLVNNAGLIDVDPVAEADAGTLERMVDVNLTGLMTLTREALPTLEADGGGHVVNVSSVSDREPSAEYAGYDATKFGVRGFTEALRKEVPGAVRVTLVAPGVVDTALPEGEDDLERRAERMTPLEPADVADAIRYAVERPDRVSINELVLRPSEQDK